MDTLAEFDTSSLHDSDTIHRLQPNSDYFIVPAAADVYWLVAIEAK